MNSISELLLEGRSALRGASESAALDAEILLCEAAGLDKTTCHTYPERVIDEGTVKKFRSFIERRAKREPLSYIIGRREFFGRDFIVSPAVLVPRPETEILVDEGLRLLRSAPGGGRFLDLGTGSGCIAISLALDLKTKGNVAVDVSREALHIAALNAERLGAGELVEFRLGSWFEGLAGEKFDLIAANPPYVAADDKDMSPETAYEPRGALFSGEAGLSDIKEIILSAPNHLNPKGALLIEIGSAQGAALREFFDSLSPNPYSELTILKDLSGRDRILRLRLL